MTPQTITPTKQIASKLGLSSQQVLDLMTKHGVSPVLQASGRGGVNRWWGEDALAVADARLAERKKAAEARKAKVAVKQIRKTVGNTAAKLAEEVAALRQEVTALAIEVRKLNRSAAVPPAVFPGLPAVITKMDTLPQSPNFPKMPTNAYRYDVLSQREPTGDTWTAPNFAVNGNAAGTISSGMADSLCQAAATVDD